MINFNDVPGNVPVDNLSYGLLLELGETKGSGFFIRNKTHSFLVTAKHVLIDGEDLCGDILTVQAFSQDFIDGKMEKFEVDLKHAKKDGFLLFHKNHDIAVLLFAEMRETEALAMEWVKLLTDGSNPPVTTSTEGSLRLYKDVAESADIYITGFPSSIGIGDPQVDYKKPLIRHGIVSQKNNTKKTIILDCKVFRGNSGGPVIYVQKFKGGLVRNYSVIGLISETVPFKDNVIGLDVPQFITNNSGYSVVEPIDPILDVMNQLIELKNLH